MKRMFFVQKDDKILLSAMTMKEYLKYVNAQICRSRYTAENMLSNPRWSQTLKAELCEHEYREAIAYNVKRVLTFSYFPVPCENYNIPTTIKNRWVKETTLQKYLV